MASILGMNTSDIRNSDQTQWVFWATALPLTLVIGLLLLGFTGGLGSLDWGFARRWLPGKAPRRQLSRVPTATYAPSAGKFGDWDGDPYAHPFDGTNARYFRGESLVPPGMRPRQRTLQTNGLA